MSLVNTLKLKDHIAEFGSSVLPSFNDIVLKDEDVHQPLLGLKAIFMNSALKEDYNNLIGFSIITKELIEELKNIIGDKYVMELGSGTGYLAKHLEDVGVKIYTVDTDDWGFETQYRKTDLISSYRQLDVSGYDTFIMSWPNYNSPAAHELILTMKKGDTLIFCGEGVNGCTGTPALHYELDNWERTALLENSLHFKNGYDYWRVYVKSN